MDGRGRQVNVTDAVRAFIRSEQLLPADAPVLVALSGGADSVVLLHILHTLGYRCQAAHCNFHLRGSESDRDEAFVRRLCDTLEVPLHVRHFSTETYAAQEGLSIEMAARELRYDWFREWVQAQSVPSHVAVAHHRDDSVETFLLNLLRGTGIHGLTGIRPVNGHIVRPLLCVGRQEVLRYAAEHHLSFVTDSTNLQNDYTRNKLRNIILPQLEAMAPAAKESILRTASHLREAERIYDHYIQEQQTQALTLGDGLHIKAEVVHRSLSPTSLLHELLSGYGFNSTQVRNLYQEGAERVGRKITSSQGYTVTYLRDSYLIEHTEPREADAVPPYRLVMRCFAHPGQLTYPSPSVAWLDADKLQAPLHYRMWQQADRFRPLGLKGRKLVSDFLTDAKVSGSERSSQCVLCCGQDIVWLVGRRISEDYKLTSSSRNILEVKVVSEEEMAEYTEIIPYK